MTTDYYEDDYYEDWDPNYFAPPPGGDPVEVEEYDWEFHYDGLDVFFDFAVISGEVDRDKGTHHVDEIALDFFEVRGADDDWYRPPTEEEADAILRAFDWQGFLEEVAEVAYEEMLEAWADSQRY